MMSIENTRAMAMHRPCPRWWRVARTVLVGLLVSAAVAGTLYVQTHVLPDLLAKLIEEEKNNRAGFAEQMGYLAPVLMAMILPYLIYVKIDRHDGKVQTELTWVMVITMALTYLVLLPYVAHVSNAEIQAALAAEGSFPKRDGGAYDSLLLKVIPWFIRLFIGLSILCLYHSMRAQREKAETVAAAAAAETAAGTVTSKATTSATPSVTAETATEVADIS